MGLSSKSPVNVSETENSSPISSSKNDVCQAEFSPMTGSNLQYMVHTLGYINLLRESLPPNVHHGCYSDFFVMVHVDKGESFISNLL